MYQTRLKEIVDLSFKSLYEKINGGLIVVESEASLQLQLSSIIKTIGDLFVYQRDEIFSIELEKPVRLSSGSFKKSKSSKAKINIFLSIENISSDECHSCAIELKFFKKSNHREPNNRYDVFKDISNLENYGEFTDYGILLVATDHEHYISQEKYSKDTADFDFRAGAKYESGTQLSYRTATPYGEPITLNGSYDFKWHEATKGVSFMFLEVDSSNKSSRQDTLPHASA
ncbi:hypothetical protein [Motilimonas eburnea]|uniref:hypothetical protein n=1 Tax=Motilimonas eburnea TaxID=1737488 RepID=UPI001E3CACBC|nr:hypothetical protein [Motilimonas eburnea]MCE2573784.1 hypothetical protein [Motilimonas eburnea]